MESENKMNLNINKAKQFNLLQIILYHLLPGIPILLVAIVCANPNYGFGLPIFLSLMIALVVGLVPVQLTVLKISAAKEGKKLKILFPSKKRCRSQKQFYGHCRALSLPSWFLCLCPVLSVRCGRSLNGSRIGST
jgi:hypothetical protein